MADSCVFCRIIAGDTPASVVYRDDDTLAFMDIQPVNPGHTLVIPRPHVASIRDLDAALSARVWAVATQIARALPSAGIRLDGLNLFLADGAEAGQEVFHVHLHVIPRFAGDGFGLRVGPHNRQLAERAALERVAAQIRAAGGWSD
ncbi:MAG TPA: HIT family protein [Ktedonobacterales bacterium]